jgi:hypothetical protein
MSDDVAPTITVEDAQMRAATDPDFRERLIGDPAAALTEAGVQLPAGVSVAVHEATTQRVPLIVPPLVDDEQQRAVLAVELVRLRAMIDPAFRTRLFDDPHGAVRETGGAGLATAGLDPVDGAPDRLDLVLAPLMDVEGELSDDVLATIDGGGAGDLFGLLSAGMEDFTRKLKEQMSGG